jgi:Protein of unknown function (DUF3617)
MHRTSLFLILISVAIAAQAQDVPQRKSGLWEITRTTVRTQGKPRITQWCIDQKSDNAVHQLAEGMRNEVCAIDKMSRDGDKLVVDGVCQLGMTGATAKTHAVITGKFDSAYKVESRSTFEPPVFGKSEGTGVISARWTGPCKADQKPGDVILENGRKVHVSDGSGEGKHKQGSEQGGSAPTTKSKSKSPPPAATNPPPAPTK